MLKFISSLLIILTVSSHIWSQCGVNFKEESRQILSNGITYNHFEDFDNDGKEDLLGYVPLSYTWGSGRVDYQFHYYKRLSANSFDTTAQSTIINEGRLFNHFVIGDVNGDGFKDIVVRHLTTPFTIRAYLNNGSGRFTVGTPVLTSDETIWAATDMNGDGKADLIVNGSNGFGYRLAQSDNSFGNTVLIAQIGTDIVQGGNFGPYVSINPVLVDDFNNDGLKDIAVAYGGDYSSFLKVFTNNGNLTFTQSPDVPFGPIVSKLRAYDFNNDGKKDFVSDFAPARIAVNNGNNTFTYSPIGLFADSNNYFSESYLTRNYFAGDFDNDGDIDLIYHGRTVSVLMKNQGNATFVRQDLLGYPGIDHLVNLDNDGRPDAVFLNFSVVNGSYRLWDTTNWRYYHLNNAVSFRKNVCNPTGQTKVIDFDGDGVVDRAFWNPQNGTWRYYPSKSGSSIAQSNPVQLGQTGDKPAPNDYDGDGKTDYAVYRPSNGTWHITGSSGQNISGFQFGIAEDKPVPADYDGDGKADIAVYRPSNGTWHLWLSGSSQYRAVQFGLSEDKVLPTDYDGDGKADIAVWRPSTQVWYILKSSDGSFSAIQYGLSTDKPVPGDYDGDGKANITLYRDGVWYVLRSDFSTSGMYFGIANDVPFFNDTLQRPTIGAYRSSSSSVYFSVQNQYPVESPQPTGNSASEIFVSSILPQQ